MLSKRAKIALRKSLLTRLSFTSRNPVEWMWKVILVNSGILMLSHPNKPEQLLYSTVFGKRVELLTLSLLQHFPALAVLWARQTTNWTQFVNEFLEHAGVFVNEHLRTSVKPVLITDIETDCSDPHLGNRTVMKVRFGNHNEWFYKPRSGENEQAWFALLHWLNEQSFPARFTVVDIISANNHSWMQAIKHRKCRNERQAARYYFRAGALLYLVHWLRGVDIHAGNIIADADQPVVVDCETLFHPKVKMPRKVKHEAETVLRTGMLPIWSHDLETSDSISALGRATFGSHSVQFKNNTVSAAEFVDSIVDGFQTMHTFLLSRQGCKGLTGILRRMRRIRYRRLYHPTSSYYGFLEQSLSTEALRSGRARGNVLAQLKKQFSACYARQSIKALENLDIPIYHGEAVALHRYSNTRTIQDIEIIRRSLRATRSI